MSRPTLATPYGYTASTCGYCSPSGSRSAGPTSKKYAFEGPQMSVQFYQDLIDKGWRRSGDFVYQPDMARTCCPQYTIRLDARTFQPNKKQRQVVTRWNRFLEAGARDASGPVDVENSRKKGKGKAKEFAWPDDLHRWEAAMGETGAVRFEMELVEAKSTPATFQLYKRYQIAVHNDAPAKVSQSGFRRFLCDSPLINQPIVYSSSADTTQLPAEYGSYHLLFKADDHLVGFSVIDILPGCVSSVYFVWDPDWAWASLGKLSALYEASLARRISEAREDKGGGWVYMGYWIANCQKMKYKSEYAPSFLLDPGTLIFHPLAPALDSFLQAHPGGYHPFVDHQAGSSEAPIRASTRTSPSIGAPDGGQDSDESSDEEEPGSFPHPPPPGMLVPDRFTQAEIDRVLVLVGGPKGYLSDVGSLEFRNPERVMRIIREFVAAVGPGLVAGKGKGMAGLKDKAILSF